MLIPTRADLFNVGAREILARSATRPPEQRITREAIYTEGTDANILVAAASAMGDEVMRQLVAECSAHFLDSAEGDALDRRIYDQFGDDVARKPAARAVVPLVFSRGNPGAPQVTLPIGYRVRTARGTEFELTQVLAIAAGSTVPVTVAARAVQAGTSGNVAPFSITQFVAQPPDPALNVTNVEPAAGGDDKEGDPSLRRRARGFYRSARRGTLAAITYGAETAPGVARANVIEHLTTLGEPSGLVFVYIADANGQGNTILVQSVRTALLEWRAAGIVCDVVGAIPRFEDIRMRLRFKPGTDTAAAFDEVRFLVVGEVNNLAPGETLPTSLLLSAARRVPGVIVLDDALAEPVGDVVPDGAEIIKTNPELVTLEPV